MGRANYKFLTDIDFSSNNLYNISKIIGNDYDTLSPDLEITTCDRADAGNLLLRAGVSTEEALNGYVHLYAGSSTEPENGIFVRPDDVIDILDNYLNFKAKEEVLIATGENSKINILPDNIYNTAPTITDTTTVNRVIESTDFDIHTTKVGDEGETLFKIQVNDDLVLTQTHNLKVNKVANFDGFTIYWDESIHSIVFAEGQAEWQ